MRVSAGELIALCVSITAIAQVLGGAIGYVINRVRQEAKAEASFVTHEQLDAELSRFPTKEYVDGNNKLLRLEVRGLRKDIRYIQMHRALPPLDDDVDDGDDT